MSATLIAVVFSLLLGHVFSGLPALRRYDWFVAWLKWLGGLAGRDAPGGVGVMLGIGIPVLLIGAIQYALWGWLYGLPGFAFALLMLLYTWGPRDLDLDVEAVIEATDADTRRKAAIALYPEGGDPVLEGPPMVEAVFRCALWRWFGVLFWFSLLGAAGALLYRLAALSAQGAARQSLGEGERAGAVVFLQVLNWPVAQLMTLGLALAADFDRVLAAWRDWHAEGLRLDPGFLGAAARASVASELAEEDAYAVDGPAQGPALLEMRDAMSLVWRVLLIWLGVLALFVLAGWAG